MWIVENALKLLKGLPVTIEIYEQIDLSVEVGTGELDTGFLRHMNYRRTKLSAGLARRLWEEER